MNFPPRVLHFSAIHLGTGKVQMLQEWCILTGGGKRCPV